MKINKMIITGLTIFMLASCGTSGDNGNTNKVSDTTSTEHVHTYSASWSYNSTSHWHPATCGHELKSDEGQHDFDAKEVDGTFEEAGKIVYTCKVCKYSYEVKTEKKAHNYSEEWSVDETNGKHYHACTDEGYEDLRTDEADHELIEVVDVEATSTVDGKKHTECSICDAVVEANIVIPSKGTTEKLTFTLLDSGAYEVAAKTTDIEGEVVIPLEYEGKKVAQLGSFEGCDGVTSVTVPNSINSVARGVKPFNNCASLKTVNWNASYTYYASIEGLTNDYNKERNSLFFGSGVETVNIGEDVGVVPGLLFCGCPKLETVSLSKKVYSVGIGAFADCPQLKQFSVDDENNYLSVDDGALYSKDKKTLFVYPASKEGFDILDSVEVIASASCAGLDVRGIILPDSVKTLNQGAFVDTKIESINLNNVTVIGNGAFYNCKYLYTVTLGKDLATIAYDAFQGCSRLGYVINLSSLSITKGSDDNGEVAYYAEVVTNQTGLIVNKDNFVTYNSNTLIAYYGNETEVSVPSTITKIGKGAFRKSDFIKKLTIHKAVTDMVGGCLEGCFALEELTIPFVGDTSYPTKNSYKLVDLFGSYYGCPDTLKKVNVKGQVVKNVIGESAFDGLDNLEEVYLDETISKIEEKAFRHCDNLKKVTIASPVQGYDKNGNPTEKYGLTTIGDYAFYCCYALQSFTVGSLVTSIGTEAFLGCGRLVQVINESSLLIEKGKYTHGAIAAFAAEVITDISESKLVFDGGFIYTVDGNEKILEKYIGEEETIVIPEGVTAISRNAFGGSDISIKHISIPSSLEYIEDNPFDYLFDLEYNVKDGYKYLGNEDNPYVILAGATEKGLTTLIVEDGCKIILPRVFYSYSSLTSVTIPDSVLRIGYSSFAFCNNVTTLNLGNGLIYIGNEAFMYCMPTTLVLPDGLTYLGSQSFAYLSNNEYVVIPTSVLEIGIEPFRNYYSSDGVYYAGSKTELEEKLPDASFGARVYCYSEVEPTGTGYYWHYVEGVPTAWDNQNNNSYNSLSE